GFLPRAFKELQVERGGLGAGTAIRFTTVLGGQAREASAEVTEPEPGRVLLESGATVSTTFTVDPDGAGRSRVRFDSVFHAGGLEGLMLRLFAGRLLRPVYEEELTLLERYAQNHGPVES